MFNHAPFNIRLFNQSLQQQVLLDKSASTTTIGIKRLVAKPALEVEQYLNGSIYSKVMTRLLLFTVQIISYIQRQRYLSRTFCAVSYVWARAGQQFKELIQSIVTGESAVAFQQKLSRTLLTAVQGLGYIHRQVLTSFMSSVDSIYAIKCKITLFLLATSSILYKMLWSVRFFLISKVDSIGNILLSTKRYVIVFIGLSGNIYQGIKRGIVTKIDTLGNANLFIKKCLNSLSIFSNKVGQHSRLKIKDAVIAKAAEVKPYLHKVIVVNTAMVCTLKQFITKTIINNVVHTASLLKLVVKDVLKAAVSFVKGAKYTFAGEYFNSVVFNRFFSPGTELHRSVRLIRKGTALSYASSISRFKVRAVGLVTTFSFRIAQITRRIIQVQITFLYSVRKEISLMLQGLINMTTHIHQVLIKKLTAVVRSLAAVKRKLSKVLLKLITAVSAVVRMFGIWLEQVWVKNTRTYFNLAKKTTTYFKLKRGGKL